MLVQCAVSYALALRALLLLYYVFTMCLVLAARNYHRYVLLRV